ncbi:SDR family NAD(P)-dependent oxidoreductase [Pseudactinotalea sp.]|uniref:SDR family NAD(P)-dependent oxidoreductase n=1 Tax=Pseudactinotalea sp. TaxID=1926260 RepID=UPI003B3B17C5
MTEAAGPLAGKVAVVTGGTRGIGRGIVQRLADDGAAVLVSYVADSSVALANEVVDGVMAAGGRAASFQGDVSDPATADGLVSTAVEHLGGLDILVNNAAISDYKPFGTFSNEDVQRTLGVNVAAPFVLSQAALAVMPDGGRIIHIGSTVATRMARQEGSLYATSKAALIGMTKGMARDLGPRRITVNLVNPGPTRTEMLERHSEEKIAHMVSFMAIQELALPEHTAAIVAALARDDAAFTTGAIIGVDGGYTI